MFFLKNYWDMGISAIDAPGGFLFEWWSVFWDIFIARTNEKHSEVAASYIEVGLSLWELYFVSILCLASFLGFVKWIESFFSCNSRHKVALWKT